MERKAKIVATIGPASEGENELERLMRAGMNVARLNFSHGTHEEHARRIAYIRRVSDSLGIVVGILQDLQGPKIRVGNLAAPLQLSSGQVVVLHAAGASPPPSELQRVPVDFRQLFEAVQVGDKLLLDDGHLTLEVGSVGKDWLTAHVAVGGLLLAHKGINLPGVRLRIAGFTDKDRSDLAFGIQHNVDAVAVSFVRSANDVEKVRSAMEQLSPNRPRPLLIAKLEKPEALDDLEAILNVVDGVMVARGDLGVELSPECVPALQKKIISAANRRNRLVITATQMLESMVENPLPSRAEASDVANAIFDGTDALMLSAETASGKYPVEAVSMMNRIACEAEAHFMEWGQESQALQGPSESDAASMARAAHALAKDLNVTAVASFTARGQSAWLLSKIRPRVPVLAFTPHPETLRRLAFLWGVTPYLVAYVSSLEKMILHVDEVLRKTVKPGDQVVLVCGFPVGALRPPNLALLHTVGGD